MKFRLVHRNSGTAPQNPPPASGSQFVPRAATQEFLPQPVIRSGAQSLIHSLGFAFDAATVADTHAYPPDSMGAVGPAQIVVFLNGRLRTFTKAGVADGVLDVTPENFFSSVMTPSVTGNFATDPQVRYDRLTARWILSIIDVPGNNGAQPNRVMIAVSDAASNGTITGSTVWSFFQFQADPANFCDYPSLGVDVNALYIGCVMFTPAGAYAGNNAYVVRKSSILGAGPITVTAFPNLTSGAPGAGLAVPRGVDNWDSGATEGYFVGVDEMTDGVIVFRRISNPGSATPTISGNISVTVPMTAMVSPNNVEHLGNTGGASGYLDGIDTRLYAAMIRNGRLWTAHHILVGADGIASTASQARNAARWYEFQNLGSTPSLVQSGTVYDNATLRADARQYIMPSVAVTGQGHAVMGFTMAGAPVGATPAYVGRLAGDPLGTMSGPPGAAATAFGTSANSYNPPYDPGGTYGRRWGDYSITSVDPLDDMSVCTFQEYNQAAGSYAVRVACLKAPPPATPNCAASPIPFTGTTGNVVISATSSGGSGFYDPGPDLPAPALPFNHLSATVSNAIVNSVTYNSPTQVTLNITKLANGPQNVSIVNPDGQSVTAYGCINVNTGALVSGSMAASGAFSVGSVVTYTVTLANSGPVAQADNPGDEFTDVLPSSLALVSASASSGSASANTATNTVTWNGAIPAGGSVTITIKATILPSAVGTVIANQGAIAFDADGNGSNESSTVTDDPKVAGASNATNITVRSRAGILPSLMLLLLSD